VSKVKSLRTLNILKQLGAESPEAPLPPPPAPTYPTPGAGAPAGLDEGGPGSAPGPTPSLTRLAKRKPRPPSAGTGLEPAGATTGVSPGPLPGLG
jgi:hypothetical protein